MCTQQYRQYWTCQYSYVVLSVNFPFKYNLYFTSEKRIEKTKPWKNVCIASTIYADIETLWLQMTATNIYDIYIG